MKDPIFFSLAKLILSGIMAFMFGVITRFPILTFSETESWIAFSSMWILFFMFLKDIKVFEKEEE